MSGGSFDYAYFHPQRFADDLRNRIVKRVDGDGDPVGQYSPATISRLLKIALLAERASLLMKETEWLYSGDTGEDTFIDRVDEINSVYDNPPAS